MDGYPSAYYGKTFQEDDRLQVGGWGDEYRTYIRFDLRGLPKRVTSATLMLRSYPRGDNSNLVDYRVMRPTSGWTDRLTWDDQPSAQEYRTQQPEPVNSWWSIPISNLYNDWQAGALANYGLRIDPWINQNNFDVFRSSRFQNDRYRPQLVLKFTPPISTPDFKMPLPRGYSWLVTTETGGWDCKGNYAQYHDGSNFFSIDFSWRTKEGAFSDPSGGEDIPVLAAASGKVVVSSSNSGNGNYVVISHHPSGNVASGFSTRYLHLKRRLVSAGQTVEQGAPIGDMGNTGISSGSHLHFGVRYNDSGSANRTELSYVVMSEWLLKSFQTECRRGDWNRYYLSH